MDIKHDIDPNVNGWSIIIPTKRASRNLELFLRSLELNSHFKHELIIICDLFTSHQTYKVLQENKLWYYQINNCNYYKNCNEGAKLATREYLVFVQDDTVLSPNWDLNISKHLHKKMFITPWMIQCWEINNSFGMTTHPHGQIEDFKIELWNDWCNKNMKNDINNNLKAAHPIIISKEMFVASKGFAYYTGTEGQHIHHEVGLEGRCTALGGTVIGTNCAYSLHIPGSGRDSVWDYGYYPNQGRQEENLEYRKDAHYPIECSECGFKKAGYLLTANEGKRTGEKGTWLCPGCNKDTNIVTL